MLIEDVDELSVELQETEPTSQYITVIVKNAVTDEELGTLRILKKRYDTFLLSLKTMIRASYNAFEERESSLAKLTNKTEGTISFVGD